MYKQFKRGFLHISILNQQSDMGRDYVNSFLSLKLMFIHFYTHRITLQTLAFPLQTTNSTTTKGDAPLTEFWKATNSSKLCQDKGPLLVSLISTVSWQNLEKLWY